MPGEASYGVIGSIAFWGRLAAETSQRRSLLERVNEWIPSNKHMIF